MAHLSGTPKSNPRHPNGVDRASGSRWLVVAAVAGIVLVAVLVWRWDVASDRRDEALRLAKDGRLAEAEPLLLAAFARNGNDVEVVAALAVAKLGGTDPGSAEE